MGETFTIDCFMKQLFSPDPKKRFDYQSRLDDYLKEQNEHNFQCLDLVKFFEATVLFTKSDIAKYNSHGLIVIQIFLRRLVDSLQPHLTKSL